MLCLTPNIVQLIYSIENHISCGNLNVNIDVYIYYICFSEKQKEEDKETTFD